MKCVEKRNGQPIPTANSGRVKRSNTRNNLRQYTTSGNVDFGTGDGSERKKPCQKVKCKVVKSCEEEEGSTCTDICNFVENAATLKKEPVCLKSYCKCVDEKVE
ncbi:Uncharacterised protein g87 [Pycnogonum litorale]